VAQVMAYKLVLISDVKRAEVRSHNLFERHCHFWNLWDCSINWWNSKNRQLWFI